MKRFALSGQAETKPNDRYWQMGVGSGHAALALRADYQQQLARVVKELGFRSVRFHGIFNDDMTVVKSFRDFMKLPGGRKIRTQSFFHIAAVYDALLEIGVKPFVELGFMPGPLASGKRTVFHYKGNVTPPKEYREWENLIHDFTCFLLNRYGKEEVESWYFEVWNEPDLRGFFWTGSKEAYYQLYKSTVQVMKRIDPNLRVGGPATSQNRWVADFKAYCQKEKLPLDFLSTHHYPGDDVGLPMLTLPNLKRMLFTAKQNPGGEVTEVIRKMMYRPEILPLIQKDSMVRQAEKAKEQAGDVPLFYTEWNVNPTCTAPLHDTTQSSAYIVKHVMDCQYIMDGCSFWCFSDIFEENTFLTEPFSGSFGLMNIYGIPKPSYWAFYLLNRLEEERFQLPVTHDNIEMAAFRGANKVQFLLYHQSYVMKDGVPEEVELTFTTERKVQSAQLWRIDRTHGNAKAVWDGMGRPDLLSKRETREIMDRSAIAAEEICFTQTGKEVCLHTALADNDVQLIELILEEEKG